LSWTPICRRVWRSRLYLFLELVQPARGDDPEVLDRAIGLEHKAIALDDAHAYFAHANLCRFYPFKRQYDEAVAECQRAIELAPSYTYAYFSLAEASNVQGNQRKLSGSSRRPNASILAIEAYLNLTEALPTF